MQTASYPVPVGHPGDEGRKWHGWGNYTFGPDFARAIRFYAVRGEDALGLACQHFGCEPGDLRYFGFNW